MEPAGPGPVATWAERWGQGLYGVGFSTADLGAMARHFDAQGIRYAEDGAGLRVADAETHGMPSVVSADRSRDMVGDIRFVYEVTNPVDDWQRTADLYTKVFGLDPARFSPIESKLFGYRGTLTLFDPPARLDRIEITQTSGDGAMHRFYQKRGPSLYMCYIETDDVMRLASRLKARNMRYAHSEDRAEDAGLFIHPSGLFGMLMGVSRTNFAWVWSGRPELAGSGAAEIHREH
jgi:catechol 2,3-dioxygenase-like lactoylglutathione lyase family enzyme